MRKDWELTPEAFDRLLNWLGPGRETAGRKYEEIRRRLIKIFASRGCHLPEELADETINRVIAKLPTIVPDYEGDPVLYFYATANFVFREYLKVKPPPLPLPPPRPTAEVEREARCLDRCLTQLTAPQRQLVLAYYQHNKRAKIEWRRKLAAEQGSSDNALKIRVHRLRRQLNLCVSECLQS